MYKYSTKSGRLGLSTTELLGCLVAVAGGAWIGMNYLGVDLSHVAYVALDETDMLEQVPQEWRPEEPTCSEGECEERAEETRLALVALDNQRQAILKEIEQRRSETGVQAADFSDELPVSIDASAAGNDSVRYWRQVVLLVDDVSDMEREAMLLEESGRLAQAYRLRTQAMAYARHGLETLPVTGVDEAALETADRLAKWYEYSQKHAEQGSEVAKKLAGGQLPLLEKKAWEQAGKQLTMQADLLLRKLEETRAALQSEHSVDFAPIQPLGTVLTR